MEFVGSELEGMVGAARLWLGQVGLSEPLHVNYSLSFVHFSY